MHIHSKDPSATVAKSRWYRIYRHGIGAGAWDTREDALRGVGKTCKGLMRVDWMTDGSAGGEFEELHDV